MARHVEQIDSDTELSIEMGFADDEFEVTLRTKGFFSTTTTTFVGKCKGPGALWVVYKADYDAYTLENVHKSEAQTSDLVSYYRSKLLSEYNKAQLKKRSIRA